MILSGSEILRQIELGAIDITPFDTKYVNPVSVDLTLGDEVAVYRRFTTNPDLKKSAPFDGGVLRYLEPPRSVWINKPDYGHDTKTELEVLKYKIDPELGWVLNPGISYLMHTAESVRTDRFVPILDGKSSIGRLFIQVHVTAGFGDPGFSGQYTLEVTSEFPVRVYPGMRICQMRFHTIEGEIQTYQQTGHYTGELACGPVGSKAHISAFK